MYSKIKKKRLWTFHIFKGKVKNGKRERDKE